MLASPSDGDILYGNKSISKIDKYTFLSRYIGVVFQSFSLITKYTALENVSHSPDVADMCDERYELVKISGKNKRK